MQSRSIILFTIELLLGAGALYSITTLKQVLIGVKLDIRATGVLIQSAGQ